MRLYLSSTLSDLQDERRAVKEILSGDYTVVESYEADSRSLEPSCVADLASCAIYIGIVGLRYGFVPPGQGKSITELEFDAALAAGLRCFVFVKEADAIPASRTDLYTQENDPSLIKAFRKRLSSGANNIPRAALFTTAEDLKVKVLRALQRQGRETGAPEESINPPPPTPPPTTELQKLLLTYLQESWPTLRTQQSFTCADLFQGLEQAAVPLGPERAFAIACDKSPLDVLVDAREFFKARSARGLSAAASVSEADGIVCGAIVRCALVAAERYVVGKVEEGADRHRLDHDPVRSSDHLVACIEAAMRFGFGLCFSAGSPQPENVFRLVHPLPEPGVRGEEGAALSAAELLATLERGELQTNRDFDSNYVKTIIEKRAKKLRTGLVVSADAEGRLQSADRRAGLRQYLKDKFELQTFFHQRAHETMPRWVKEMQDTLLHALGPIFAISLENAKTKEESMLERTDRQAPR